MATEDISTIRSSGGDYSTLTAWESGEQKDLVSADQIAVAECYNDWPSGLSGNVTVNGWTDDTTRYPLIRGASGSQFDGSGFDDGDCFTYIQSSSLSVGIRLYGYSRVEGILVVRTGYESAVRNDTLNGRIAAINCGIRTDGTTTNFGAIVLQRSYAVNCFCLNNSGNANVIGFGNTNSNYPARYYNCGASGYENYPFVGGSVDSDDESGWMKNCWFDDGTITGVWRTGQCSNNASYDYSGAPPPGTSPYTSDVTSADFVDAANNDFHLDSGSALTDAGVNLYSIFQYDIDGDEYPSSGAWPIGFDYVAGGGAPTLSSPGVINVQSDRATPQVTLTF